MNINNTVKHELTTKEMGVETNRTLLIRGIYSRHHKTEQKNENTCMTMFASQGLLFCMNESV